MNFREILKAVAMTSAERDFLNQYLEQRKGSEKFSAPLLVAADQIRSISAELGVDPYSLAFLARVNALVVILFLAEIRPPCVATQLELQMTLSAVEALRGAGIILRDFEHGRETLGKLYAGEYAGYRRRENEMRLTREKIVAAKEHWPAEGESVLAFCPGTLPNPGEGTEVLAKEAGMNAADLRDRLADSLRKGRTSYIKK